MRGELGQAPDRVADPALLRGTGLGWREHAPAAACVPDGAPARRRLRAFPVVGDYTDHGDVGTPQHQGRHEGIDVMAARAPPASSPATPT